MENIYAFCQQDNLGITIDLSCLHYNIKHRIYTDNNILIISFIIQVGIATNHERDNILRGDNSSMHCIYKLLPHYMQAIQHRSHMYTVVCCFCVTPLLKNI